MGVIACVIAFVGTYAATRKSLGKGIACVMAVGYAYGLFRSHFPDSVGYFLFDVSVLGLYIASIQQIFAPPETRAGAQLKHWTVLLIVLPVILFFVPVQDYLIQLVGLRGNAFFLVFLLLGATLTEFDLSEISLGLAALNIA